MRTGSTFEWNPERIVELRKNTGLDAMATEQECGLVRGRLYGLETRKYKPTVDDLIKLSEYYHVSINYILRMDDNPGDKFPSYEKYLNSGGTPLIMKSTGFISLWPVNIYDVIFDEPIVYFPNEDQVNGLEYAISTLTDREQKCVYLYFKDEKTYSEIAGSFNVTTERIRQIIARAIRKLRHPNRANYLKFGKDEYDAMMKAAAEQRKQHWIDTHVQNELERMPKMRDDEEILNMDLSVRSYNCLKRVGVMTLDDVVARINNGSIFKIRNLGRKSVQEILDKVNGITGSSYTLETVAENFILNRP